MLKFIISLDHLYTRIACAIGAAVIAIFFRIFPAVIDAAAAHMIRRVIIPYSLAGGYAEKTSYPCSAAHPTAWGITSRAVTMPASLARGRSTSRGAGAHPV
jgi:hypothetical protein